VALLGGGSFVRAIRGWSRALFYYGAFGSLHLDFSLF
jgi:hypothetical protein